MTILIAGGGIGGLCTAIALAQNGISTHILEQAETFSEAGAGIQIGPNGMRLLQGWGMGEQLSGRGATPACVNIHEGLSGISLNKVPLGKTAQTRYGAPYKVFHRSELQMPLLDKARSLPGIEITSAFQVSEIREQENELIILSSAGERCSGRLLIGADGLWSHTRKYLFSRYNATLHWQNGLAHPCRQHRCGRTVQPARNRFVDGSQCPSGSLSSAWRRNH